MNHNERSAFERRAKQDIRACILRHLAAGDGFPSARSVQRETGIASLATVSRYIHLLAEEGAVNLPRDRYDPPREGDGQKILAVRHKKLHLEGREDILLSLVAAKTADGRVDVRVVGQCQFCGPRPAVYRVLSCTDTGA